MTKHEKHNIIYLGLSIVLLLLAVAVYSNSHSVKTEPNWDREQTDKSEQLFVKTSTETSVDTAKTILSDS